VSFWNHIQLADGWPRRCLNVGGSVYDFDKTRELAEAASAELYRTEICLAALRLVADDPYKAPAL
jgi:hypothetical protein